MASPLDLSVDAVGSRPHRMGSVRIIIACGLGNALEWFDFAAYAMFATAIAKNFFPTGNDVTSLLATFAAFAVGFVMRPVGAVLLGNYADKAGRKAALSASILLMALGTAITAMTPNFASIGITAPVLIVLARLLQGLSAGGEIGGAISFLAEHAPADRRGFFAAWQQASVGLFYILAGLIGYAITNYFTPNQIDNWAWRLPFFFGLIIAPIGLYIRSTLAETPIFARLANTVQMPVSYSDLLRRNFRALAVGVGVVMVWTVCSQMINYMPTYTLQQLGMKNSSAFLGFFVVGAVSLLSPLVGSYSDRIGRRPYVLTLHAETKTLIVVELVLAILLTLYSAPGSAVLAELYQTANRSTGIGLSYSISLTLFGGFTPMISLMLVRASGNKAALAYYLAAAALISLISLVLIKDQARQNLE